MAAARNKPPRRDERRKARERKRWPTKQNAPHHPKVMESAQNTAYSATTTQHVKPLALHTANKFSCCAVQARGTIHSKPRGPVLQNTKSIEVAAPTDKRGIVMSKISRHGFAHIGMVYGHGGGYPQGHPHGYGRVLNHHAHPLCFKTQRVVLHPIGAKTMQQVNLLVRTTAPMSKAAPAIPTPTEAQAFALLEATTASTLATWYLKRDNIAQARRKLRQALQALNALEVAHA